ncbi:prophage endopeptidase tail [Clostridium beijerinckii]|uniref:phage tail spike protein n=1 Tax=Clostridium beijerinckii TaxID=1520 RepID=UPI00098BF773|nr:phage tail spike protein [Clostridium beijerinckii]OOM70569.1 prophage endopeptidase tail [Clostridium beijerinckii]
MIRLFKNNETDLSHNEWILNEIISCKVTEEINEDYTMELEYPLEDTKNISSNLVTASIISTPTIDSRDNQQFRIIQKETNSNSIIVQNQSKLLADLKENRIRAMTIVGKTRKEAIQIILNSALDPHNYKVGNLDTNTNTNVILEVKEGNLLSAIIGSENSVLSEYGGEFIVSNDTIDIVDQRGEDNGVVIEYGKNISSIKETIDLTDLATVLIPKSGDYRLPEYQIVSSNAGAYEKKYYRDVELNLNIWDGTNTKDEKQITIEEAYKIMRDTCNKMFNEDKVDQITFNYVIDFIELSKTEEYKNYKALENVNLGDTVYIKHKKLNLDLQGRVNKINYTVNSEGITTIDKVEIGFARKNITDIISDTVKQIQFTKQEIILQVSNSEKKLNARLDIQEEKIDAVVEQDGTGMGWELSKNAFKVACVGASGAYVIIDVNGLEVHDGKFRLYKNSKLVFYVNANGRCTADGGFVVDDGDANYKLDKNGLSMTNENGYTSRIYVADDATTLVADDDFEITNTLNVKDSARFRAYTRFYSSVDFDNDNINIGSKTLKEYIENVVNNM